MNSCPNLRGGPSVVWAIALAGATGLACAGQARADESVVRHSALAISADGALIASIDDVVPGGGNPATHGKVVVRSRDGRIISIVDPCAACTYATPDFSRAGGLAFTGFDAATGISTIFVGDGNAARIVASFKGTAGKLRWAPDGSRLAVLATLGAHKSVGAGQAGRALVGDIGADVDEQRIAVVPAAGGSLDMISPPDTYVYEFAWYPSARGFVTTASKGDGDSNWWVAKLIAYGIDGSEHIIAAPKFQINRPVVSPAGDEVAVIGGLMSDFGVVGGDIYVAKVDGGPLRNLTQDYKGTFTELAWTEKGLRSEVITGADEALVSLDERDGAKTSERLSAWTSGGVAFSLDGKNTAFVGQSYIKAPEIFTGALTQARPVTADNAGLPARVSARSITWRSDGYDVQGWLLGPVNVPPGKRPLVAQIHGGPSSAAMPSYVGDGIVSKLISRGYYVFQPNARGSFGQGEAFTRANIRDFGAGDLRDILAGIDKVETVVAINDQQLGIFGHSYGGFMAMNAVTHSARFHAAVAGAGIANWVSYYGQNGIDQWMIPFLGKSAYDDPEIYDRISPIRSIHAANTPTFIYVGERDIECPPAQSIEFWHGLLAMHVPTSLFIYPGEGHGFHKPGDMDDVNTRILAWFDRYLAIPRGL